MSTTTELLEAMRQRAWRRVAAAPQPTPNKTGPRRRLWPGPQATATAAGVAIGTVAGVVIARAGQWAWRRLRRTPHGDSAVGGGSAQQANEPLAVDDGPINPSTATTPSPMPLLRNGSSGSTATTAPRRSSPGSGSRPASGGGSSNASLPPRPRFVHRTLSTESIPSPNDNGNAATNHSAPLPTLLDAATSATTNGDTAAALGAGRISPDAVAVASVISANGTALLAPLQIHRSSGSASSMTGFLQRLRSLQRNGSGSGGEDAAAADGTGTPAFVPLSATLKRAFSAGRASSSPMARTASGRTTLPSGGCWPFGRA